MSSRGWKCFEWRMDRRASEYNTFIGATSIPSLSACSTAVPNCTAFLSYFMLPKAIEMHRSHADLT